MSSLSPTAIRRPPHIFPPSRATRHPLGPSRNVDAHKPQPTYGAPPRDGSQPSAWTEPHTACTWARTRRGPVKTASGHLDGFRNGNATDPNTDRETPTST